MFAFPVLESGQTRDTYGNDDQHGERICILKRLLHHQEHSAKSCSIVTSIQALLQPVPTRESLAAATKDLRVGDVLDVEQLQIWLVENGFHATSAVELPVSFRVGEEFWISMLLSGSNSVRLELDDEIESIRQFDVRTQRSIESRQLVELTSIQSYYHGEDHLSNYLPTGSGVCIVEMADLEIQAREYLKRADDFQRCHLVRDVLQSLTQHG